MRTKNPSIAHPTMSEDILFAMVILCTASSVLLSLGSFLL